MGTFDKKFKQAASMWERARERAQTENKFENELEDGRYIACLSEAKIGESQSSGRLQVAWTFIISEGEYKGQTKRSYDGLESEDNLMWLGRKLVQLGYEIPEDLEEVKSVLEAITKDKPIVRVRLKTKGEFQNVYIDQVIKGG